MASRDNKGRFTIGNKEWKKRATDFLKSTAFTSPVELWKGACSYFSWVKDNPWKKTPSGNDEGVKSSPRGGLKLTINEATKPSEDTMWCTKIYLASNMEIVCPKCKHKLPLEESITDELRSQSDLIEQAEYAWQQHLARESIRELDHNELPW